MLFSTKLTLLINTLGLIDSALLENHHNKRRDNGSHKWPKTFLGGENSHGKQRALDKTWVNLILNTTANYHQAKVYKLNALQCENWWERKKSTWGWQQRSGPGG